MRNIFLTLCIGIFTGFANKTCAQVQKGDMLLGSFSDINSKSDGKSYTGEVISVESETEFTLRFSHSGSIYHFKNMSNDSDELFSANVISSKGGKYNSNYFFNYLILRPIGADEDITTVFWNIRFSDGRAFPSILRDELSNEKYFVAEMLHSGNFYKMGYNFKVYETEKGSYKAGTPFDFIPLRLILNSDKTSVNLFNPNPAQNSKGISLEELKKNIESDHGVNKNQILEIINK